MPETADKPKRQVIDHSGHDHPGTSAARKACREALVEAAAKKAPAAKKASSGRQTTPKKEQTTAA
jgi:hypothetical protein